MAKFIDFTDIKKAQAMRILSNYKETDKIVKAFNEEEIISKAEGSKGGKVIGHTKSGKPVYAGKKASHEDYKNFTSQDHRDAGELHGEEFNKKEKPSFSQADKSEEHHNMATEKLKTEKIKKSEDGDADGAMFAKAESPAHKAKMEKVKRNQTIEGL